MSLLNKRFFVKIRTGKTQATAEVSYFRDGLEFSFLMRWMWFFKYRAALYQVQHPRHFVELRTGDYEFREPTELVKKRLKDKISGKKATITKNLNVLELARKNWSLIFPIEDDLHYQKAMQKTNRLIFELQGLEQELKELK